MNATNMPWLDHYDTAVPPNLEYDREPLTALLDRAARDHPARAAVKFRNYHLSYAELNDRAGRLAMGLTRQGVQPGDRVGIMLPNLPQTLISYWGALKAGATGVLINPLYMESELSHILADSGAKILITLDLLWARHRTLLLASGIERFFITRVSGGLAFPLNWLYALKAWREGKLPALDRQSPRVRPFTELLKGRDAANIPDFDPYAHPALLQYTGGTTGQAKGVMLTHANLNTNVRQAQSILHAIGSQREIFLGLLPFFHIYGLTVCVNFATAIAATVVTLPRFDPLETLKAINASKPTVFPGTPSIYMALLQQKNLGRYDLKSIRYCVSGSAPMPLAAMRRFQEAASAEIIEGYGLTEASPVTHLNPLRGKRKQGSIGLPFPDTDAKIVDLADGVTSLAPGEPGELVVKGPQIMEGYWRRPQDTAEALRDGWLHTGDVAVMDDEGYFTIVDRKKDMIISQGFNVYPREIEEVLHGHPKIADVAAIGVPHATRGEVVKVFIVTKPGQTLTRQEVQSFCKEKLAGYKTPKSVEFRTDLPKTLVGKVLRRVLRQEEEQATPV